MKVAGEIGNQYAACRCRVSGLVQIAQVIVAGGESGSTWRLSKPELLVKQRAPKTAPCFLVLREGPERTRLKQLLQGPKPVGQAALLHDEFGVDVGERDVPVVAEIVIPLPPSYRNRPPG